MSNVFTDTTGILATKGLQRATVIKTEHRGRTKTKYGSKDMQMFILQVTQTNADTGETEIAEIHQPYHRSFNPRASLVKFLAAFDIKAVRGMRVDFDDLVGKKLDVMVIHDTDANGRVHANIQPLPFAKGRVTAPSPPSTSPLPEYFTCADGDCTTQVSAKGARCPRHQEAASCVN